MTKDQLGLHSTDYWTPYLSAWARLRDFDAKAVFQSLNSGDRVVRWSSFRATNHVVHVDNLPIIIPSTGVIYYRKTRRVPFLKELEDDEIDSIIARIENTLEDGPLTTREMKKILTDAGSEFSWLIRCAMAKGRIVRATASHARSALTSYALVKKWIKEFKDANISEEEATSLLLERYIETFGPNSLNDFTWWISTTKREAKAAFETLTDDFVSIDIDGITKYVKETDLELATSLEEESHPTIWFLPYEDHLAKAFIERSWYIENRFVERLFPRNVQDHWPKGSAPKRATSDKGPDQSGEIRPSIWLDGQIIGRWELTNEEPIDVAYDVYRRVSKDSKERISDKKDDLVEFLNKRLLPISKKGWEKRG